MDTTNATPEQSLDSKRFELGTLALVYSIVKHEGDPWDRFHQSVVLISLINILKGKDGKKFARNPDDLPGLVAAAERLLARVENGETLPTPAEFAS